jgi:hypothetical protein
VIKRLNHLELTVCDGFLLRLYSLSEPFDQFCHRSRLNKVDDEVVLLREEFLLGKFNLTIIVNETQIYLVCRLLITVHISHLDLIPYSCSSKKTDIRYICWWSSPSLLLNTAEVGCGENLSVDAYFASWWELDGTEIVTE